MVYKAFDTLIEREVAIKILPDEVAGDEVTLRRFLAEAKAAGKLAHPNAVAIYEVGQENGTFYLVMEYVSGGTVAEEITRATRSRRSRPRASPSTLAAGWPPRMASG